MKVKSHSGVALNELIVMKVKSHSGVALNEEADIAAGDAANSDSPDVDTVFEQPALASDFTFSWPSPKTDEPRSPLPTTRLPFVTGRQALQLWFTLLRAWCPL
eukprot:2339879-Rhodomonas_salina.1